MPLAPNVRPQAPPSQAVHAALPLHVPFTPEAVRHGMPTAEYEHPPVCAETGRNEPPATEQPSAPPVGRHVAAPDVMYSQERTHSLPDDARLQPSPTLGTPG